MKTVYCSNCGTRLTISRKAMPKYGTIIDLVQYHNCPDSPVEFDLTPLPPQAIIPEAKGKFADKLNSMDPRGSVSTAELRDQRKIEHVRTDIVSSTAPGGVLTNMKNLVGVPPAHDISDEPEGGEE